MVTAVMVALAVTAGALILHISYTFGRMNGISEGLEIAEEVAREVFRSETERIREDGDEA